MITLQLTLLLILRGYFHIIRDKLDYDYKSTVFAKLPDKLQAWWFNPELTWENKYSDWKKFPWFLPVVVRKVLSSLWQLLKSWVLVDFLDFKHFLKFLEINTWIWMLSMHVPISFADWVAVYVLGGAGVFIGNLNFFGAVKV